MRAIKRRVSCRAGDVLLILNSSFAVDLLPSKEDVDQTASRNTEQTVFVNYKYNQVDDTIVNPAAIEDNTDVSGLPWINFVIGVPRPPTEEGGKEQVDLTMKAGNAIVKSWTIAKSNASLWWM